MATNQVASTNTTNIVPVQAIFNAAGTCLGLVGPGGNYFSPPLTADTINSSTINSSTIGVTTPAAGNFTTLSIGGAVIAANTAPAIASGFGTSPTITGTNTFGFKIVIGTGGAASGVITLPAAPNGWVVTGYDTTNSATIFIQQSAFTTTSATIAGYSMTTGLAANFTAADVLILTASPF
jgi:hypothetical protein